MQNKSLTNGVAMQTMVFMPSLLSYSLLRRRLHSGELHLLGTVFSPMMYFVKQRLPILLSPRSIVVTRGTT